MRRSLSGLRGWLGEHWRLRRGGGESALLIPVPEADFVYDRCGLERERLEASGLPLHVTVLYPFLKPALIDAEVERALAELAGSHSSFRYSLAGLGRFPGVLYLAPSPPDGFVQLTRAVHAGWPEHPPYRGAHKEIVPHVTLTEGDEPAGLAADIEPALPVPAVARELLLMTTPGDGRWSVHARFPLAQ
jgi:2'-5' RNA ligase